MDEQILLWKTLGEIYNYPNCCILNFCKNENKDYFFDSKNICVGSGYVPCPICFIKIKNMNKKEICNFIGRNIFLEYTTTEYINLTYDENFLKIANKNKWKKESIETYRKYLKKKI
jgi:hypothetical protein